MHQAIKGVFDILPQAEEPWQNSALWRWVESQARQLCHIYGYHEIRTPILESTDLFLRHVGGETDIVSKEMYSFLDKGGRSISLRPEGTAPVIRALIEHRCLETSNTHKLFYLAPMFRYERQQAGRYRQHHQWGVEIIGARSPYIDVEAMDLLFSFFRRLGIKNLTLHLHSLGQFQAREQYIEGLKSYLAPHLHTMSEDSQRRFHTNPLRILDSKSPEDQSLLEGAPELLEFLSPESRAHFDSVCSLLNERSIPYLIQPRLVRGLDYYNDTVFEMTSTHLGSQNSLGGGGRYDGLIQQMGGPSLPSFGFGCGLERVLQTVVHQSLATPPPDCVSLVWIPMDAAALHATFQWASRFRDQGLSCDVWHGEKRWKNLIKRANDAQIPWLVVVGEQELATHLLPVKEMATGMVTPMRLEELEQYLLKKTNLIPPC